MNAVIIFRRLKIGDGPVSVMRSRNGERQVYVVAAEASKSVVFLQDHQYTARSVAIHLTLSP
jgi:hypothetical protein